MKCERKARTLFRRNDQRSKHFQLPFLFGVQFSCLSIYLKSQINMVNFIIYNFVAIGLEFCNTRTVKPNSIILLGFLFMVVRFHWMYKIWTFTYSEPRNRMLSDLSIIVKQTLQKQSILGFSVFEVLPSISAL